MIQHQKSYQADNELGMLRKVLFRNNTGVDIPPYAVMQFTGGFDDQGVPQVGLVTADNTTTLLCFNLGGTVLDGEVGWGVTETPNWVAYSSLPTSDSDSDSDYEGSSDSDSDHYCTSDGVIPMPGEEWGTKADSFFIHQGGTGFNIIGTIEDDPMKERGICRAFAMLVNGGGCGEELEVELVIGVCLIAGIPPA